MPKRTCCIVAEVDIPTNVLAAGSLAFGAVTGAVTYLWRRKDKELDDTRAELRAVQAKYEDLLKSLATSEPERKEALNNIARALADNTALLRERIRQ